jgi:branched-chain amino acid transport system permease protein
MMERIHSYYFILGIFAVMLIVTYLIINSRFGLAFTSLRDSEPLAKHLGVNEYRSKLTLFAISAFLSGIMGALYCHYFGLISSHVLGLDTLILLLVIIVIGGLGKFPGAAIAAFIFVFANEYLRPLEAYRSVIFGVIVAAVLIGSPQGITAVPEYFRNFFKRRQDAERELVN